MMTAFLKRTLPFCALIILSGCSTWLGGSEETPLEGERLSVLELETTLKPENMPHSYEEQTIPAPWKNAFWPQTGGYPNHSMQHLALNQGALSKLWSVSIGKGNKDNLPLTAQPIVVDGEIFTLDTKSNLSAFDTETGKKLWKVNVKNPDEDDHVIGGGISYASGVLYVTNGFDEVLAIHPANGEIFWRAQIAAPSRAAPTIMDGRLYVITLDNRLQALDAANGTLLWEYIGISETAAIIGAASPAVNHDIVVAAFSSGEVSALRVENGSIAWSDNLSKIKNFGGLSGLSDIKALPIIDKGLVIAMSFSGRLVAIDERTGTRVWQREIGGTNTPWVTGDHLFVLTSDNQLVALARKNGTIHWVTKIESNSESPSFFTGPILAGGRLIIAGTDGRILEADPKTGDIINNWDAGKTITIPPIVAGETLYILDDSGTLSAYR